MAASAAGARRICPKRRATELGRGTEIRTARLLLRPFRETDVDDALAYRDDAELARFLPHIPQPFTRGDAEAFVAVNMSEPWETMPTFAVVFEGDGGSDEADAGAADGPADTGQPAADTAHPAPDGGVSSGG